MGPYGLTDVREHCVYGEIAIKDARKYVEEERFDESEARLRSWNLMNSDAPRAMEETVHWRKTVLFAQIRRIQGRFQEALEHVGPLAQRPSHPGVHLEELEESIACEIALAHYGLGQYTAAWSYLQDFLARLPQAQQNGTHQLVQLTLSECLYAQGLYPASFETLQSVKGPLESDHTCTQLRRLTLSVKLAHQIGDHQIALRHWKAALEVIQQEKRYCLPGLANTTLIILGSILNFRGRLSNDELCAIQTQFRKTLAGGGSPVALHYIPGLRDWLEELKRIKERQSR